MKFIRFLLKAAMLLAAYTGALAVYMWPWLGVPLAVCVLAALSKKPPGYSAYGNARWATSRDLQHMLDGGDQ